MRQERSQTLRRWQVPLITGVVALMALATSCSTSANGSAANDGSNDTTTTGSNISTEESPSAATDTPAESGTESSSASVPVDVNISYSEKTGDEIALWVAEEAGYFKDEGLNVTLTYLASNAGVPALISNQVQIGSLGGSQILSAVAQGTDMKYVLTLSPVSTFQLWAQKKYATADALKGQRVGITKTTGSQYIGTVQALAQLGLKPTDVEIVSLGSVPNVDSAMIAGSIAAAASHPPSTVKYEQKGYVKVIDLAEKKLPQANTGYATLSSYAADNSDVIQKVVNATLKAIQREKTDKDYTEGIMKKYMGITDPAELDATYQFYAQEIVPSVPTPEADQFTTSKETIGATNDAVAKLDLNSFIDPSYVQKAASSLGISE